MKDSEFINYFMVILGVLVAITVLLLILANTLASQQATMDVAMLERTKERIAPVGQVNVGSVPTAAAPSAAGAVVAAAFNPEAVYQSVCQSCHAAGLLEAPRLDDTAEWQKRLASGVDNVYKMAIQGVGNMPAKGGRVDISDDNFKKVVDYMLDKAGVSP